MFFSILQRNLFPRKIKILFPRTFILNCIVPFLEKKSDTSIWLIILKPQFTSSMYSSDRIESREPKNTKIRFVAGKQA